MTFAPCHGVHRYRVTYLNEDKELKTISVLGDNTDEALRYVADLLGRPTVCYISQER